MHGPLNVKEPHRANCDLRFRGWVNLAQIGDNWLSPVNAMMSFFYVLLTVHLSTFISVFNQLDAQNLFYNKFYFMPLHVSSTCAHHQEVKIALHSLWYHHTYRCDDTRGCVMQFCWLNTEIKMIYRVKYARKISFCVDTYCTFLVEYG